MNDQDYAFDQWQLLREEGIEEDCDSCYRDDHESRVPWLSDIVCVVECDDALDLGSDEVATAADVDLPAQDTEPSGNVGEEFLRAWW